MGARGPAPTPTAILEMRGSWRADEREGEVAFDFAIPDCPSWLSATAKKEWQRLVVQLERSGVLQVVDRDLLAAYCVTVAEFAGLCKVKKPDWRHRIEMDRTQKRLLQLAQQFGFSPSARTRVKSGGNEKKESTKAKFFRA